jgi:phage-related protein (TIGR01555 family)
MPKNLKELVLRNDHMRREIELMRSLRGQDEKQQMVLSNTVTSLVQTFFQQSNLTSFMPLSQNNIYAPLTLNYQMLMYAYKTHGPLQTAINQPVLDALRGGLDLEDDEIESEELQEIEDALESDNVYNELEDTMSWVRLFGGGALIVNAGDDPEKPLDFKAVSKTGKMQFYDATRWELGTPHMVSEFYNFYGQRIHWTRVITASGKRAPWIIRQQLSGWGMSEMERMLEPFNIYLRTMNVMYELLNEAKVDVFRLKRFNSLLLSPTGTNVVQQRLQAASQLKSYLNALVMDTDDEFTQKQITFAGLAEMMNQARITLSGNLKMPFSKLWGTTAGGGSLANSSQDDLENYNSMVESEVRQPMKPMIRTVLRLITAAKFGEPFDINFKFKSLRMLSALDEENVKTQKHTRYKDFYDKGVMTPKEWVDISHKDGILPVALEQSRDGAPPPQPPMGVGISGADRFGSGEDEKGRKDTGETEP